MHVGFFESEVDAARAYDSYIVKRFGNPPSRQFRLNFDDALTSCSEGVKLRITEGPKPSMIANGGKQAMIAA